MTGNIMNQLSDPDVYEEVKRLWGMETGFMHSILNSTGFVTFVASKCSDIWGQFCQDGTHFSLSSRQLAGCLRRLHFGGRV